MAISVRRAEVSDIDWLIGQLRDFDRFANFKKPLMGNDAYCRVALKEMLEQHVVFIAETPVGDRACDIERIGLIAGWITPHPFNPELRVLTETFWWVIEKYRGTRAGLLLLNAFQKAGAWHQADWILFTLEHHSPVSDKHLLRRGYVEKERSYLLEAC